MHEKFDGNKPVTIFIHGFRNTQQSVAVTVIVDAYLRFGGHNLVVLDWTQAVAGSYLEAYVNVEPVICRISIGICVLH